MKIIIKYICIPAILLLCIPAFAQYHGGQADGAASDGLLTLQCDSQPPSFFAYFGGVNDGAAVDQLTAITCSMPPSYIAYMGGEGDGSAVTDFMQSACGYPPQFFAYFGGEGDGFSMSALGSCPVTPPVSAFTATATDICAGGSVTFTDTSTNIPAAWSWSFPGGTPETSTAQNPTVVYNTPGTYSVTLIATNYNGSDTTTKTDHITVTAIPSIITTTPGSRCNAGQVTLSATATAGSVNWYATPDATTAIGSGQSFTTPVITQTTTYYAEAMNSSCASIRTAVTASVNTVAPPTGTANQTFCEGETVAMLHATGEDIIWYDAPTSGNVVPGNTLLTSGSSYYASQTTTCESLQRLSVAVTVGACLGIKDLELQALKWYPNPVENTLTITHPDAITEIAIYNALGQMVYAAKVNTIESTVDMSAYQAGSYLVRVTIGTTNTTIRIIKK